MRKIYLFHREAAVVVQRVFRGYVDRERARSLREAKASAVIARNVLMSYHRKRFLTLVLGCTKLQRLVRCAVAKRLGAAVKIQSLWRMWCACGTYWGLLKCIIVLQNRFRKGVAVALLRGMKKDMKNVGKLQEEKERLKSEMGALKAMLKSQAKSDRREVEGGGREKVLSDELTSWKSKYNELEKENLKLKGEVRGTRHSCAADGPYSNFAHLFRLVSAGQGPDGGGRLVCGSPWPTPGPVAVSLRG